MKKFRCFMLVVLVIMMIASFAGCSREIDWDAVKRDDIVAEAGNIKVQKKTVSLMYSIDMYTAQTTSSMLGQLGETGDYMSGVSMDESYNDILAITMLANKAEQMGYAITMDEARDAAYEEFIFSPKNYPEITGYVSSIKSQLYLSDELLLDYAVQYKYIKMSAENYVKSEYDKLDVSNYSEVNSMADAVAVIIADTMKNEKVTAYCPKTHEVKGSDVDFTSVVNGVKYNYNELFL